MSLAHPRNDHRGAPDSANHEQILAAISDLKSDKEALQSALKSALFKRDELIQRMENYEETSRIHLEKRRILERENAELRKDNADLLRKAEMYRREIQKLTSSREEEQREMQDLLAKARNIESKRHPNESGLAGEILKYAQFMLEKLESEAEILTLFRGRVLSLRHFWSSLQEGRHSECLLETFQFVCDLLVYRSHTDHSVRVEPGCKSVSSQTLCEKGTNTRNREEAEEYTPRFPAKSSYSARKPQPLSDPVFNLSESIHSPKSARAGDGYAKLMDESEHLLSSLHHQSDRLVKLNSQLQQTIQSSPRRSPLYHDITPSQLFKDDSLTSLRKPNIGIPSSPQSLHPVQETLKVEELSSETEPAESSVPDPVPKVSPEVTEPKRVRKTGTSSVKAKAVVRKSPPNSRLLQYKTDVKCT